MTKSKKGIILIIFSLLLVLSVGIFFGCDKDTTGGENCVTLGNGSIVEKTNEEGKTTYTAVADKWNVFSGWYNGVDKYSDKATIIVDKNTPDGLTAKFETSGMLSFDRILNGSYNSYDKATESEGEYLNLTYAGSVELNSKDSQINYDIEGGGYISLNGEGFNEYQILKENDTAALTRYYIDDSENATLYLDIDGRKVTVEDFSSFGQLVFDLPGLSDAGWSIQKLLGTEVYNFIEGFIGFRNSVGFIGNVENSENQTKITFNVDKLLNDLKNKVSQLKDEKFEDVKKVIETLTSEYTGILNKLPKITLDFTINYNDSENLEKISSLEILANFEQDYKIKIEDETIVIPAGSINFTIESMQVAVSQNANAIPQEVITSFPEIGVHAINVHADGILSFLDENVATGDFDVIDQYNIEFDSDINLNAILDAVNDDKIEIEKIDWNNFGFLSFKISLIENQNDPEASRHNGSKQYLNILIDTEKYGAKALVNIDLFNPIVAGNITTEYIVNATYDIPALIDVMPTVIEGLSGDGENQTEENSDKSMVVKLLAQSILTALNINVGQMSNDEVLFNLFMSILENMMPENNIVQEGLTFTEFGSTLAVDEVKEYIEEKLSENAELASYGLANNIFGKGTSHIAIKSNNSIYGCVLKNQSGDYVDNEGNTFADEFNAHQTVMVAVANDAVVEGLTDKSFTKDGIGEEVNALIDKNFVISKGLFSDLKENSQYENCKGKDADIQLKVFDAKYKMINENSAEVKVYFSFSTGILQSLLVNTLGIPYGLIEYTIQVDLT